MKSVNLKNKIWFYLTIFVALILLFLWIFQILFLNAFYDFTKRKEIEEVSRDLIKHYNDDEYLNKIAYEKELCIQLVSSKGTLYSSTSYNKGCYLVESKSQDYKIDFLNSSDVSKIYEIVNPRFQNKTILKGIRVNKEASIFVSSSLMPLDSTIETLKKQFVFVIGMVFSLALLVGYFISKKLSDPLVKMNTSAKELAKGNYDVNFETNSDVDEIQDLSQTLSYMKEELSKTEDLRRDLLANVGHDLKTPLTMIRAYAEMVRDITYKNKEKREANLNLIIDETNRLHILVEDIIELSKLQTMENDLQLECIDIHQLIQNILSRFDILKETENYDFIYENQTSYKVLGNKKNIEQVLYNLMNNAINYTGEDKKIYIVVNEVKDFIRIAVQDTGSGIKEEDIPYIWDKYYHSEKKHKRNKIGTGLGLAIVKNILEKHGNPYGVRNIDHKTEFYFYLKKYTDSDTIMNGDD